MIVLMSLPFTRATLRMWMSSTGVPYWSSRTGPIGPIKLDEYGNPILDIHIRKVARVNGKLTNTILKTYPKVSQFWTADPKVAVQQPVFSRDFPPSKYLE